MRSGMLMTQVSLKTKYPAVGRVVISDFLDQVAADSPAYNAALAKVPAGQRPGVRVLQRILFDVEKTADDLAFKYSTAQCQQIYDFYRKQVEDIYSGLLLKSTFDLKKAALIIGFTCVVSESATFRVMLKALESSNTTFTPASDNLHHMVELLSNLLGRRDKIIEIKRTLEEIRDYSIDFILKANAPGNKTILNHSEDILVMLIAKRLYNAMYWYMYGKQ